MFSFLSLKVSGETQSYGSSVGYVSFLRWSFQELVNVGRGWR